ncbi:hypothetical protein KCU65_g2782, partial [Aureobasidium melanogenum]
MAPVNQLFPLQSLGQRIQNVYSMFHWGKRKQLKPDVLFDKQTCCNAPNNAAHNTWWPSMQPPDYPRVIGYGSTLEEALNSLYNQLQLGPQLWMAIYGAQNQGNVITNGAQSQISGASTIPYVTYPTSTQSLSSGSGNYTPLPATLPSLQAPRPGPVPQSITSDVAKQTAQLPQKVTIHNDTLKDRTLTSNSSSTPATSHTTHMPNGGNSASNPSFDQLMEGMKSLQRGLETMSNTLRMTDFQPRLAAPIPSSAESTSTPSTSSSNPPAQSLNMTADRYKQPIPMFSSEKKKLKQQGVQGQLQDETNIPKAYQSPSINNAGYRNLTAPVYTSGSKLPSTTSPSASSSTVVQTMTPTYASMAAISASTNALALSQRTGETDPSLFQLPSEISDASSSAIAGPSTNTVQNEHAKRKHDDIDDGVVEGLRMNVEQRASKTPKIQGSFQPIKNEKNSPKKIKTEEPDSH